MIIKFTCEYNGKNLHGFQRQKNLRTVQAALEEALSKYLGSQIKVAGSGRTDAGVHARAQVCSFQFIPAQTALSQAGEKDLYKLSAAVNAFLTPDVSVRGFAVAGDNFHAQFDAKAKTYVYRCYVGPHRSPLRLDTHLQIYKQPDISAMQAAANQWVGTHDFRTLTTERTDTKGFVRTIYSFDIKQSGDEITFTVRGNGFMRKMVRMMVGTLLGVGTAAAHGLTLESVEY